jgi:hypothetical protein
MPGSLETDFEIGMGNMVKGMTGFVFVLFIILTFILPITIYDLEGEFYVSLYIFILLTIIFIPIFIGGYIYSPTKYTLSEDEIKIIRPVSSISIPIYEIKKVEDKEINVFKTIRLWANGGVFSLSGAYYNKQDGKFWMYAKNSRYVMIHAKKKYVLSPDEKEQFIIMVKNYLGKHKKNKD